MSSALLRLRPYQSEAIISVTDAIDGGMNRPAVVLPTGAGKTVIFSHLANEWIETRTGRPLILVHRDELVTQTEAKLHAVAPGLKVGVVKAQRDEFANADVIVGSVQTLRMERRRRPIENVGLVVVDEAHHAAADSYRTVLDHFGCFTGRTPAVGFSATLSRTDKLELAEVWDDVVYRRDILDMIPEYLCDVRGKLVTVDGLSLAELRLQNGDLAAGSLTDALLTADAQRYVLGAFMEHARDRKTILFAPTVEAAHAFADAFRSAGVRTGVVWGAMPAEERRQTLADFSAGRIEVLCNCMVLTEGFDEPSASCAIIARPTASPALYVQMVGRVLRLHPGKTDALVLDVVGASADHRLATLADLTSRRIEEIEPGESLTEAATRERNRGNPKLSDYVVNTDDVDLFHRSRSAWLKTKAGVWFIPTRCQSKSEMCDVVPFTGNTNRHPACGTHMWFIWPDGAGQYNVGVRASRRQGGRFFFENMPLEAAMSWAEQCAEREDSTLANRTSSWRRKREKPTEAQVNYAKTLGIETPEKLSKRELSDAISIQVASNIFDRALR